MLLLGYLRTYEPDENGTSTSEKIFSGLSTPVHLGAETIFYYIRSGGSGAGAGQTYLVIAVQHLCSIVTSIAPPHRRPSPSPPPTTSKVSTSKKVQQNEEQDNDTDDTGGAGNEETDSGESSYADRGRSI